MLVNAASKCAWRKAWLALWAVLACLPAYALFWGQNTDRAIVRIEQGDKIRVAATHLKRAGALKSRRAFIAWAYITLNQNRVKAGEYEIPEGSSLNTIKNILTGGRAFSRYLTVPEGLTSKQIFEILDGAESLGGKRTAGAKDGELFPQTYAYDASETKDGLILRMKSAMNSALADEWEARADGLPYKSPFEALIMASLIEKETGAEAERGLVASVFVNRMRRNMRLQSDATVSYGLGGRKRLYKKDVETDGPFNTYTRAGLPPSPICNPGLASIRAALHPADTKYLYFVADGMGGHRFSDNLSEHEKNREKWRKVRGY
ncbi:MAG: endolytic transglycosylase MltG [Rickettsiales bacterium]|jgi:UPF0755 protein|nr:endolytic transglycosylase MltG [Rickettsiales bacterium]